MGRGGGGRSREQAGLEEIIIRWVENQVFVTFGFVFLEGRRIFLILDLDPILPSVAPKGMIIANTRCVFAWLLLIVI